MSLDTDTKGAALHWNGPPMGLLDCDGGQCESAWEGIRRFHKQERGWRDIAYSFGVCPGCGRRLDGRGWDVRTAANGTTYGNDHYHAFMVLFGEGEPLTDVAKAGVRDLAAEHKRRYGRMRLVRHGDLKSTTCPGPEASGWVAAGAPDPRGEPDPDPDPEDDMLYLWQGEDPTGHDGYWLVQFSLTDDGYSGRYRAVQADELPTWRERADNDPQVRKSDKRAAPSWFAGLKRV